MASPSRLTAQLAGVVDEAANLFQAELRTVRAELSEKMTCAARGGSSIAIGVVLGFAAVVVLLLAVARWLAIAGLPEHWGLLIVGLAAAAAAFVLAKRGIDSMKGTALMPVRSFEQVRSDVSVLREHVG